VIPCKDQDRLWSLQQKVKYKELLKSASNKIVLYPEYAPGVMQARDQWMVWLNILICVWLFMMDG
jgi:uncharacterized phage-like protein YoqJ